MYSAGIVQSPRVRTANTPARPAGRSTRRAPPPPRCPGPTQRGSSSACGIRCRRAHARQTSFGRPAFRRCGSRCGTPVGAAHRGAFRLSLRGQARGIPTTCAGYGRRISPSSATGSPRAARANSLPQQPIVATGEIRQQAGHGDRPARDFHLDTCRKLRISMDLLQSQHRKPDGPQAKAADPASFAGSAMCIPARAQMSVGYADELAHAGREAGIGRCGRQLRQVHAVRRENLLGQPASAMAAVLPHVLQDVGHLQPLRERHGQALQRGPAAGNDRRVFAKQLGEHVAHDPRHVVA